MRQTIIFLFLLISLCSCKTNDKKIVGETAWIEAEEVGLSYLSRIDTGAANTSIHAIDLNIENPAEDKKQNKGKKISFTTLTADGKKERITTVIDDVVKVTNSQGTEYRYEVKLTLKWQGVSKKVTVNLRDRSKMTYKLLIGRSWLKDDILVDVSKKAEK